MTLAPPQPAIALPPSITFDTITLTTKPTANLSITQVQGHETSDIMVVFLNGLIAPQGPWLPIMALMLRHLGSSSAAPRPQMLAYDRFGQGRTIDRDPLDSEPPGKEDGYGHDVMDSVRDLHQLITQVNTTTGKKKRRIVFIANSIGCAIARIFATEYADTEEVAGILFLDSMMANSDFVDDIFPDPDTITSPDTLPEDVTPEMLRETRDKFRATFHPSVKNAEGLDRRNLPLLLPHADKPFLERNDGKKMFITVVGHDPAKFEKESLEGSMRTPVAITRNYTNPKWKRYNEGLTKLTVPERVTGVVIAKECGHFIQMDDPGFVAKLACELLERVGNDV
ncbi:Alpha/Beta hydrolase protein [Poronia punctata]|nr:Alpha/Beta hydrolase protein [Poronia punctata]